MLPPISLIRPLVRFVGVPFIVLRIQLGFRRQLVSFTQEDDNTPFYLPVKFCISRLEIVMPAERVMNQRETTCRTFSVFYTYHQKKKTC